MVVLMDVSATGDGDVGSISSDPGFKDESARIDRSLLDIPSSIPSSCIYRCDDFIRTKIADGFYGDVYKVRHRETEEVMVLKMNKPDVEKDNCTMLDEIKLMSHLSHENVIRFLGICVDDSRVHLLCEYVNGGDLEGLLLMHSIHLEWSTRLYLARDISEGMRYLHKNGVIHRDLTSKNCLIKEKNGWRYAIVADLGLATEIKEQSIVGSPYNMAPELLRGEPYDEKADVFSYGIILCEIIGRVQADPDELPRTHSFGLDVEKFQLMTGDCPHEFLQTALCCCQMLPSSRPTFAETAKHLEFILVGYKFRPDIGEAIDAKPPRTIQSMEKIYPCSKDTKHNYSPAKHVTAAVEDNETSPKSSPPAIIVSTDETSPVMIRSADKRRQSWIASRYKLFNTATDDLVKNTPGKLKSFFHRVLRVQTHYDPSKQKKSKDSAKNRSASQLKSYSVINSDDENVANHEQASSPISNVRRFLRRGSSDRDNPSDLGSREDSVDGEVSPRSPRSENALTLTSSRSQPSSPKMPVTPRPSPNSRNPTDSDTLVSKLLDKSNRPRCESTPLFYDSSPEPISRRTASHRECQMNNVDHSSPVVQVDETGKIKNKKSPFWFLKRRESKCKDTE